MPSVLTSRSLTFFAWKTGQQHLSQIFYEEQIRLELFSEVTLLAKGRNGVPAQTVYFQSPGSSMDSTAFGEVAVSKGAKELGASRTCTAWAQLRVETSRWSMVAVLTGWGADGPFPGTDVPVPHRG